MSIPEAKQELKSRGLIDPARKARYSDTVRQSVVMKVPSESTTNKSDVNDNTVNDISNNNYNIDTTTGEDLSQPEEMSYQNEEAIVAEADSEKSDARQLTVVVAEVHRESTPSEPERTKNIVEENSVTTA